ncbi:hypothetical protein [Stackebrandtia soli]|uniref:hypothetical protein n=1 Tax=Stackebrandtia soli TaxID=1892856 RepID=UPI0039EC0E8F
MAPRSDEVALGNSQKRAPQGVWGLGIAGDRLDERTRADSGDHARVRELVRQAETADDTRRALAEAEAIARAALDVFESVLEPNYVGEKRFPLADLGLSETIVDCQT